MSRVPAGNIAVNGGPQRMIGNYAVAFGGFGPSGTGAGFWGRDGLKEFSNRKHARGPQRWVGRGVEVMSAKRGFARWQRAVKGQGPCASWRQVLLQWTT